MQDCFLSVVSLLLLIYSLPPTISSLSEVMKMSKRSKSNISTISAVASVTGSPPTRRV